MMKYAIKLKSFDTVVYETEHTQEVRYIYSIGDSLGVLEINLTIPDSQDPVEYFMLHLKDLYKGFNEYIGYYKNFKYRLDLDKNRFCDEWYLSKIQMW